MKPLVIIKAGSTLADLLPLQGDFEHWIASGVANPALPIQIVDPRHDALPDAVSIAGAIVTGSHAMVTERRDWSEATAGWMATLVECQVPLLGICYGHQLLAHALGGEVGYHPAGMEIGTTSVRKLATAADDALLDSLPEEFPAHTVHKQSVLRLPQGATLLACNEFEAHHAFRVGDTAWGVQFHPEFNAAAMRAYLHYLGDDVRAQGGDVETLLQQVAETPASTGLLQGFGKLVLARQA